MVGAGAAWPGLAWAGPGRRGRGERGRGRGRAARSGGVGGGVARPGAGAGAGAGGRENWIRQRERGSILWAWAYPAMIHGGVPLTRHGSWRGPR